MTFRDTSFRAKIIISKNAAREGNEEEVVEATILGPFAIHASTRYGMPYVISHIKTGLGLMGCRNRLHGLRIIRFLLTKKLCWNFGSFGKAPNPWPDPGFTTYRQAIDEAREKYP